MTKDEFLTKARQLRTQADNAEREFLMFLIKCERMTFWREFSATYTSFLEEAALINAARYERFVAMRKEHGSLVDKVSTTAVIEAACLPGKDAQREMITMAQKWEHANGVTISPNRASRMARNVRARYSSASRDVKPPGFKSYEQLVAELDAAMKQNAALKQENLNLRAENAQLRKALKARKPQPKSSAERRA